MSGLKYSTINKYAVSFLGQLYRVDFPHAISPTDAPEIKLFMKGLAKTIGREVKKANPLTVAVLRTFLDYLDAHPSPNPAWNAALANIAVSAFWAGFRFGAVVPKSNALKAIAKTLTSRQVQDMGDGLLITIHESKTIQDRHRTHKVWLSAVPQCPSLCPVTRHRAWKAALGGDVPPDTPLSTYKISTRRLIFTKSVYLRMFNKYTSTSGPNKFTGHSWRRGFALLAAEAGVPPHLRMQHVDWASIVTLIDYQPEHVSRVPTQTVIAHLFPS